NNFTAPGDFQFMGAFDTAPEVEDDSVSRTDDIVGADWNIGLRGKTRLRWPEKTVTELGKQLRLEWLRGGLINSLFPQEKDLFDGRDITLLGRWGGDGRRFTRALRFCSFRNVWRKVAFRRNLRCCQDRGRRWR